MGGTVVPSNFPSIISQENDAGNGQVGGKVVKLLAAGTLLIGDVVYLSAADTVAKSTTQANYATYLGVVVGGYSYDVNGCVTTDADDVGVTAALVGEWVIVQVDGIARVKSDGAILATSLVIPDATVAGECDVAGTGIPLGIALEAIADGEKGRILILSTPAALNGTAAAGTLTGATLAANVLASSLTSVGVLTELQVDNININGNTISSTAGTDLLITPLAGQQIVLDGAIIIDAGVVTGITSLTADLIVLATLGLRVATNTPASAAATGVEGTIGWDDDYIYVAIGTDTWKRAAISTW